MNDFQSRVGGNFVFNKKVALNEMRLVDVHSLLSLYISQSLLLLGIVLILFNNLDLIEPGSYFGAISWLTAIVFSIGIYINFIAIPFLYFSSFKNFKRDNEFWDRETFWILPLFFFGTFFLKNSNVSLAFTMFVLSILVIALVHMRFFLVARKTFMQNINNSISDCSQYFITLKYLSAYYLLLIILLVLYNPLQHFFVWIRIGS